MIFHAGFDTDQFPGLEQLQWLRSNTNLRWCGYYLAPAPSHIDRGWMGKRAALVAQGWGLLPIFLGQQTVGPGSHHVNGMQGSTDGLAAVQLMHDEGFPAQACVYIDWEDGSLLDADSKDYLAAWAGAVNTAGYRPGIYCSHYLAGAMAELLAGVQPPCDGRIWAWKVTQANKHAYSCALDGFPSEDPTQCGYDGAIAWQCAQNCTLSLPGAPSGTMAADLSSSSLADPSAPA